MPKLTNNLQGQTPRAGDMPVPDGLPRMDDVLPQSPPKVPGSTYDLKEAPAEAPRDPAAMAAVAAIKSDDQHTSPKRGKEKNGHDKEKHSVKRERSRDRLRNWWMLLLCLAVPVPALVVELNQPNFFHPDEARAFSVASETWNHAVNQQIDGADPTYYEVVASRVIPYHGGQEQFDQPPGMTWLQTAALLPMGGRSIGSPETMNEARWRLRVLAVVLTLMLVASVYWAGHSIGGIRTATFAALVCAGCLAVIYHGRIGSQTIGFVTMVMFSMAGALWAMRPLRPLGSFVRQGLGWLFCGLGLGAAVLISGPSAGPVVTFPLLVLILLCPNRPANAIGFVAAHIIAALCLLPWAARVHAEVPDVWTYWLAQMLPADSSVEGLIEQAGRRSVVALFALLPWTLWLIAALTQPFSASSAGSRTRQFIGWGWFITTFSVLLVLPDPIATRNDQSWLLVVRDNLPDLLLLVPVASVLIGEMFSQYVDLGREEKSPRLWRWLRWHHTALLVVITLFVGGLYWIEPVLIDVNVMSQPIHASTGPMYWLLLAAALLCILVLAMKWSTDQNPTRAVVAWAIWSVVLISILIIPLSRSESMQENLLPNVDESTPAAARLHPPIYLQNGADSVAQ